MKDRKTYKQLLQERDILEKVIKENPLMNDTLLYYKKNIEKQMIPYEIVQQMKLYYHLLEKLPIDIIFNISSFDYIENQIAMQYVEENIPATYEAVNPKY